MNSIRLPKYVLNRAIEMINDGIQEDSITTPGGNVIKVKLATGVDEKGIGYSCVDFEVNPED